MNGQESIQEYIDIIKNNLIAFLDEIDKWYVAFCNLLNFVNIKVDVEVFQERIAFIKSKVQDLYNSIIQHEENIDELFARSLLGRIIDLDDLITELITQSKSVKTAGDNIAEGLIPSNVDIEIPTSWREVRGMMGR